MEKVNNSQHIQRLCNPTVPRFRANVNRVTVNRSNLRVIEAKEETSDQRTNSNKPTNLQNNIKVICVSKNVNDEKTLKNYAIDLDEISDEEDNNDLDEISDSPLVDEADDWENISEGSLRGDSDVEERGGSTVLTRIEIPIGYRPYSIQRLTKYKNMAFFKPRMYYPSPNKVMVGCVSANEENGESFVRHEFVSSGKENGDADVEIEEVESDEKNEIEMVVESPEKELSGPVRSKLIIQEELESSNEDILGVEFLVEVWKEVGVTFHNYLCLLCYEELEKEKVIEHFISIPHRIAYLDKHFPNFTSMFYKNSSLDNSQEKLPIATLVKEISGGGGEPALSFVTSCEYVSLCRQKLEDEVNAAVFRSKDPVTALVKELSLIVAARSEEFVNDFIDYSQYRTITTSDNALDGPLSKDSVDVLPVNQEEKPCGIVTTKGQINQTCGTVTTAKSSGKPNLPEKELGKSERKKHSPGHNHHKQHCCNLSHRLSRSAKQSTAGAKLENDKSTSKGGSTKSATDLATKSIPSSRSSSKADYKSRNEIDKRRTSSSHCGKCNGLKRSHDGNKGHTKRCDCKKDSSLTSGREIKRKDDSSKENLSRKSERSRSVTSSSNDKKKCTVKDSSSSRHTVATAKVYRSDSKYKWQSEAYRKRVMSKDGKSLESEKKDEKTGEKGGDHSRGNNHSSSATDQSNSHEKKINDDKRKHSSTSHQSRSPKRAARVSPKSSDDKKSPLKENRDSSTLRKGRSSPVHQSSGSTKTSSTSRHSPARSSTTEQKQRSLPDGVHTVSRHRSKSPHHSTRRRSRSPLSVRRRERPPFPLRRRSRSPLMIRKRSRSPLRRRSRSPLRRRSRSPSSMRRRSRSPLSVRKWSRSPNSIRKWSRSPLSVRRPLSVRKRSKTPSSVYRKRSRSPSSVGHINRQMASFRRVSPMSSRDSRSRHLSPHGRVRSPIRSAFKRSVSPLHRRRRSGTPIDSQRRSRSSSCTRSISNKGDSPFKQPFATPFLNVDSHHENFQYPVPPVNSQSYTPDGFPAPWNAANPADNYNYSLTYPPVNPAYLPTTYPQYAGHPAHVPPYPNTAYPPPIVQPVPPAVPPTSLPTHPIPTRAPVPVAKLGTNIPVQYPNLETLPPSGHPNEKIFHELRNVVTKLFGMNETRPPPQMESRNAFPNKPPSSANERMLNRNVHSQDIPFLGAAGTSNPSLSHKSPEDQERMYVETLHKLRSEFGSFQIPDEIFKLALKGMFPEHLLNDQIFEMLNKKCLEQGEHLRKSPKLPNMSAKVEFKESTHFPKQGNIFPIVKPGLQSEAFANPNHNSGDKCNFSDGRQRNTNDVDFRVKSNFPAEVHRPGEGNLQAQFKKKTLAERLASVLTKLGMDDVSGELLIEMLHRLGAFNRSLPLQNITENQIIAFLNENGYLRRK